MAVFDMKMVSCKSSGGRKTVVISIQELTQLFHLSNTLVPVVDILSVPVEQIRMGTRVPWNQLPNSLVF